MKLPFDKEYLKISFHVVITLVFVYFAAILLKNIVPITNTFLYIIGTVFSVLSPLWVGIIIAYLLDPAVEYFQNLFEKFYKKNFKLSEKVEKILNYKENEKRFRTRTIGTFIVYIIAIFAVAILFVFLKQSLSQTSELINSFDIFINRTEEILKNIVNKIDGDGVNKIVNDFLNNISEKLAENIKDITPKIIIGFKDIWRYIINFMLGMVIAFYFLKDKYRFRAGFIEFSANVFPGKFNRLIRILWEDIDAVFSGYIRGQLTDAVIMASLISICLTIVKIDFAVVIGVISGFSNVIPYVGAIVGLLLAVLSALISGSVSKIIYVIIIMLVLQQIDSIFISPRVLGKQVDLNPVVVISSLSAGGALFGIVGMILAIPFAAVIKIIMVRCIARRKKL